MFKLEAPYRNCFVLISVLCVFEFFIFRDLPFFWDAISKSSRANWIYSNHFSDLILPTDRSSGHPQLWTTLIALFWTVFGKTIASARFLLLLINIGVGYQVILLFKYFFKKELSPYLIFLVFLDPTFLAQTTSLNNDMLLLFFTLLGLNAVLRQRQLLLLLALTGALFTNLRGIYIVVALAIIQLVYYKQGVLIKSKKLWLPFICSATVFLVFCVYHYTKLGWVIVTPNPAYNSHRELTTLKNIGINTIVYIKNFLEYGRLVLYGIMLFLGYRYFENHIKTTGITKEFKCIFIPILVFSVVFFLGMVPFSNPIGTRYFMIVYILLTLLLFHFIQVLKIKYDSALYGVVAIALISGNFWVYPATISQSWDSSLAYLNYYPVERKMEDFLESSDIERQSIGTRVRFNNRNDAELIELKDEMKYSDFNMESNPYIMLSNIENYTKDEEFLNISQNWELVKSFNQCGIFLSLYKNPKFNQN
ncbi:hypothetical protein [Formosa haliotis]|uniref:hypothetical protein n=1 Tax=Formosa haliotis TaxID=1555194 RepID=UPI0008268223|nr:hypothetical protein [Formosa haliotis]